MTVCIAAVCGLHGGGPFVVAASDRMITIGDLEYEPDQTKYLIFGYMVIGLIAGNMELHASVAPRVHERLNQHRKDQDGFTITVQMVAEIYADEFATYSRNEAERTYLIPKGFTLDKFYSSKQACLPQHQAEVIDDQILCHRTGASALIAGLDATGAHIYQIDDTRKGAQCMDTPFFAAIGGGEPLVTTQFMVSRFDKNWSLPSTLWLTYSAKAKAQVAAGVGFQSDLMIISPRTGINILQDAHKKFLSDLFSEATKQEREIFSTAADKIEEHLKAEGGKLQRTFPAKVNWLELSKLSGDPLSPSSPIDTQSDDKP